MSKIDPDLFSASASSHAESCPDCGAPLVIRQGKLGAFLGCSTYPACQFLRPLASHSVEIQKVLEGAPCPECGHPLAIKKGRYGLFIGCTQYPLCTHIESSEPTETRDVSCPACGKGHLVSRTSRYGKTFYACDAYPACKYVVNDEPVAGPCPVCGWGILVIRTTRQGQRRCCPQKLCDYQSDL